MTIQQLEEKLAQRPESPLFAVLANEYLIAGRAEEAKRLCQSGLQFYPSYTTAYWILAKCHAASGDFHSAVSAVQDVKSLGSNSPLVENFYQQCLMHLVAAPQSGLMTGPVELMTSSATTEEPMNTAEPAVDEILPSPTPSIEIPVADTTSRVELSAEELAQIRPASIDDEKRILSRTLAEIYAMQGEFGEAILTYELLKHERPEMSAEFDERIRELDVLLRQKIAEQQQHEARL